MNFKPAHLAKGIALAHLKPETTVSWPGLLLRLWVMVRLPLLLLALYLFSPDEFIWLATITAIHLIGTAPERAAFFILIALTLSGSFILSQRIASQRLRYLAPLIISFVLFLSLFQLIPGPDPLLISLGLTAILALNTISETRLVNFITSNPGRWLANIIFAGLVGFSELLLLKPFLLWLPVRRHTGHVSKTGGARLQNWLPVTLLLPGLGAFLLSPYSLSDVHRTLFPDPAVHLFARGNFSWTELDLNRRVLYASGYGTNYLHAYDIDTPEQPPLISAVENGYAQGFAYNPLEKELYVYNVLSHHVLTLDAATLNLKRSTATTSLSPGDVWLAWDPFSDRLAIASEADEQIGVPTVIIDRKTGKVLDQLSLDPGNIALHPHRPWLYMSFLRRINELLVYDLQHHQIVKRTLVPERFDRMIFASPEDGLDLFVSSPLDSTVVQFDAETLERKATINTIFGGRAIAVDSTRNLLLCGSLVTHRLEVINLTTRQRIAEYYLGPWLRTIVLDSQAGTAYVSAHGGLFTVQYAE